MCPLQYSSAFKAPLGPQRGLQSGRPLAGPDRDGAGRLVPGSTGWRAEGWRTGGSEAEPKRMVAVCLLGSGAGLVGQPEAMERLRGAADEGGPSRPLPTAAAQLGEPGAWGSVGPSGVPRLLLPAHQPAVGPGPGSRQAPGNARPWWEGWACPSLSSEPPGVPARCGHHSREGGHLARDDLCPSPGRLQQPPQVAPTATPTPAASISHLPTLRTAGTSREIT